LERGADFVFALNNDTVVSPETIPQLVARMQRRPEIGILTPKVLYFSRPDLLYNLGARSYPFLPLPLEFGHRWRDGARYSGVMEYDYVTGCAMLIRKEVFARVGLFEESYFMYYEDGDFCRRVRQARFCIACDGSVKILHKAATSSKILGAKMVYYRARNRVLFYRRYPHGPAPWLTDLTLWITALLYSARSLLQGQSGRLNHYWSGFLEGWR
jgi:GT2 family glycosyltransferase